jgi:hypothetical protein
MWRLLIVILAALTAHADQSRCGPEEMGSQLRPSNAAFSEAMDLKARLMAAGLNVECVLPSKMEILFESQKGAALFRTNNGDFEVLFLPDGSTFDSLTTREQHGSASYSYLLTLGKDLQEIDSPRPQYFLTRANKLFVISQQELANRLSNVF